MLGWIVAVATFAYFVAFPLSPTHPDEAIVLYAAKRLLQGQVLYRDVFEFLTPLGFWFFAGAFAVTGPSLLAARVAMAAMNALAAGLLFGLTRRVAGIGAGVLVALAFAMLCFPVWRMASPHWLSTSLCLAIAATVLAERGSPRGRAVATGVLAGLVFCVQQQRGVFIGVWVALAVSLLAAAEPPGARWRGWRRQATWIAVGWAAVVGIVLGVAAWRASLERLVYCIFTWVFEGYRTRNVGLVRWGGSFWGGAERPYTWPWLLRPLPLVLPVEAVAVAWAVRRRFGREEATRAALVLLAASMAASVLYFPDLVHVGFVAPFFFVVLAGVGHRLARLPPLARRPAMASLVVAAALVAVVAKGTLNVRRARDEAPERVPTAIGTLAMPAGQRDFLDAVRAVVRPGETLFGYGVDAWLYLLIPSDNPTPYSLLIPVYNTPAQFDDALAALERRPPRYFVIPTPIIGSDDRIARFFRSRYASRATHGPYTIGERVDGR